MPPLSETSRAVLDRLWNQALPSTSTSLMTAVQMAANKQGKVVAQLALETGLSIEILDKLDRHIIDAATIPKELCKRLANALQQSLSMIEMYLGLATSKPLIAETPPSYRLEGQSESFREAIEQSTQLSNEQKDTWRSILAREGL